MANFNSFWLLALLFIFHDFEELVSVPTWVQAHSAQFGRHTLFGGVGRSDILAVGIWEEFCLYITIAMLAGHYHTPLLMTATTVPYLCHLVMHIVFSLVKKSYVPGVFTAIIELPVTSYYLVVLMGSVTSTIWQCLGVIIFAVVLFVGNLGFIHWGMQKLSRLIR